MHTKTLLSPLCLSLGLALGANLSAAEDPARFAAAEPATLAQTPGAADMSAGAPLTEDDSVRLGLARPDIAALIDATLDAARGAVIEAGRHPNPTLDVQRESMPGTPGRSTERTIQLSQQFDLAGKRGLRRGAAQERLAATEADTEQRRIGIAAEIRRRFYEVLYRQALVAASRQWERRMGAIADTVQKLHRGGEVAGYDRRRMALERTTAQSKVLVEQAEYDKARQRLAALVGERVAQATPRGELIPADPPALELLLARLDERPELRALELRAGAFDLERKAAQRGWVPDLTVGLGRKTVDTGAARDTGTVLSLSVPLPLFDRGQDGARGALAQAGMARSESRLQRARLEGEVRGLWQQTRQLNAAARDYHAQSALTAQELARIAEAAYRGGEGGILELLDAYRSALEAENRAVELAWGARQGAIELDTIAGNGKP